MTHRSRRWIALSLFLGVGVACSSVTPGDSDGGGPESGVDASEDSTRIDVADAGIDVADTSIEDAGDDVTDASDDITDASDDVTDASDDVTDASDDVTDAVAPDTGVADAGVRWVIVSCSLAAPDPNAMSTWIDSEGNRYRMSGLTPGPQAGTILISALPPPVGKLPPADLVTLLDAVRVLDISVAGHTTVTGPIVHMTTRHGLLYSSGVPAGAKILVDEWIDGVSAGHKTVTTHNDPAAVVVRSYSCFTPD